MKLAEVCLYIYVFSVCVFCINWSCLVYSDCVYCLARSRKRRRGIAVWDQGETLKATIAAVALIVSPRPLKCWDDLVCAQPYVKQLSTDWNNSTVHVLDVLLSFSVWCRSVKQTEKQNVKVNLETSNYMHALIWGHCCFWFSGLTICTHTLACVFSVLGVSAYVQYVWICGAVCVGLVGLQNACKRCSIFRAESQKTKRCGGETTWSTDWLCVRSCMFLWAAVWFF